MTGPAGLHRDGTLECLCWCGRSEIRVSRFDVRAGRTGSCSPECQALGERYLKEQAA